MDQARAIAEIVDQAMTGILGEAGFDSYAILCNQTAENRARIEAAGPELFDIFLADEAGDVTNLAAMKPSDMMEARMRAAARVQQEIGRRLAAEEADFRQRVHNLYGWSQSRKDRPGEGE